MPQIELVLAIGQYAQSWHLADASKGLTERVAAWRAALAATDFPRIVALPHPSWRNNGWLKRNPWFDADMLPALRCEVREVFGKAL
jgi:uracil-DNA glycosylase